MPIIKQLKKLDKTLKYLGNYFLLKNKQLYYNAGGFSGIGNIPVIDINKYNIISIFCGANSEADATVIICDTRSTNLLVNCILKTSAGITTSFYINLEGKINNNAIQITRNSYMGHIASGGHGGLGVLKIFKIIGLEPKLEALGGIN